MKNEKDQCDMPQNAKETWLGIHVVDDLTSYISYLHFNRWSDDLIMRYVTVQYRYFHCQNELSYHDGIILNDDDIVNVMPNAFHKTMLEKIYSSHLGATGCLRNKWEKSIGQAWPMMTIKEFVSLCSTCTRRSLKKTGWPFVWDKSRKTSCMAQSCPSKTYD